MTDTTLTPSRLWKRMTTGQRLHAASALWRDEEAKADQMQAALLIAKQWKFRPKTVQGLDAERKARHLAGVAEVPDTLAARLLILYHLAEQRPMMGTFLDALGIQHEEGLIKDDDVKPDPEKLGSAAAQLAQQFPPDHVSLYLNTLLCQDPETWGGLEGLPQRTAVGV
jgi:hypothetical protein